MNSEEFEDLLQSKAPCELAELIEDLNKRLKDLESE